MLYLWGQGARGKTCRRIMSQQNLIAFFLCLFLHLLFFSRENPNRLPSPSKKSASCQIYSTTLELCVFWFFFLLPPFLWCTFYDFTGIFSLVPSPCIFYTISLSPPHTLLAILLFAEIRIYKKKEKNLLTFTLPCLPVNSPPSYPPVLYSCIVQK